MGEWENGRKGDMENGIPPLKGLWGKAVNLMVVLKIGRLERVSPPFEGGVAGTIDYLIFTSLISRPGWLIYSLDGDPHGEYHKIQKDENRDKYLESLGFTVLRFENRFVFQEPEYLKDEIKKFINGKKEPI